MDENQSVIEYINSEAKNIKIEDIHDEILLNKLITYYRPRIHSLAFNCYKTSNDVSRKAFEEQARELFKEALNTFIIKKEHWKNNRDINTYLLTCLNRLSASIVKQGVERTSVPVCPACKYYNDRSYLRYENKKLKCDTCIREIERLEAEIVNADAFLQESYKSNIRLRKVFKTHTRKGYKCPDCKSFIPKSYIQEYGVSCPYDKCGFFGRLRDLCPMTHPLGVKDRNLLSLDMKIDEDKKTSLGDLIPHEEVDALSKIEIIETFEEKLSLLQYVINTQSERLYRNNIECPERVFLKQMMYKTYQVMTNKYPEDMISYLVNLKYSSEDPIQAKIFQKYIEIIENGLPFSIYKNKQYYEVFSLRDPILNLFLGESSFRAIVDDNRVIPNNTIEKHDSIKSQANCFIGYILDVVDLNTNTSIKGSIINYNFNNIQMSKKIKPGSEVKVSHLRIPPHYEMMGMVNLQRIRRRIVDSVYLRLHGEKRPVKR